MIQTKLAQEKLGGNGGLGISKLNQSRSLSQASADSARQERKIKETKECLYREIKEH